MLNRIPQTRYDENVDMTLINRRDGQRLILYTDNPKLLELYPDKVLNVLTTYHKRQFVDYVICSSYQRVFRSICNYLGIPILDYEGDGKSGNFQRLVNQLFSGYPTAIVVFAEDAGPDYKYIFDTAQEKHIPLEIVRI